METRVSALEGQITVKMSEHLEDRITHLEQGVKDALESRLLRLEDLLNERIGFAADHMVATSRSWWVPFSCLSCVLVSGIGLVYTKYYRLEKLHAQ